MATTSPAAAAAAKDMFKEHIGLRRSLSGQDLVVKGAGIRRSNSDNQLSYHSVNRIRAMSTRQGSRSAGVFPFQISSSIIPNPIKSLLFDPEISEDTGVVEKESDMEPNLEMEHEEAVGVVKRANWVERLLEIRRQWKNEQRTEDAGDGHGVSDENVDVQCGCDDEDECAVNYRSDEEERVGYDRETFSRLLVKVPWSDAKQFSQLAFLCNLAYVIPEIKVDDLRRYFGLQFVTSSLEKKAKAAILREKLEQKSSRAPVYGATKDAEESEKRQIRSSAAAYKIAASAASYIHAQDASADPNQLHKSAAAAQAAASTMTAVVAAGEEEKQEAAKELQSLRSSPCEWFVCDDPSTYTRCFVIQGSDSLASWQANLFFEPTEFEGTDVLVHRGIYEAAKGIYEQFMPEITEYRKRHGDRAKFQFTGHSLGGSLSLIVNLMLLSRGVLNPEATKPVVTFGSPFVFCGGQRILADLGLDESHVHCVIMHRDIVPRAFSCNYPDHVALVLKRLNGSFRTHPCLNKNKLLYSPLGKVFILQPSEKTSPPHPLLPPGNALYTLDKSLDAYSPTALHAFLNRPHPLETLSHPGAYGSDGSVLRDHDSSNYVKAVNGVLREHTKLVVRRVRKQRRTMWPVLTSSRNTGVLAAEEIMTRV